MLHNLSGEPYPRVDSGGPHAILMDHKEVKLSSACSPLTWLPAGSCITGSARERIRRDLLHILARVPSESPMLAILGGRFREGRLPGVVERSPRLQLPKRVVTPAKTALSLRTDAGRRAGLPGRQHHLPSLSQTRPAPIGFANPTMTATNEAKM